MLPWLYVISTASAGAASSHWYNFNPAYFLHGQLCPVGSHCVMVFEDNSPHARLFGKTHQL